jgi:hypothetical protein
MSLTVPEQSSLDPQRERQPTREFESDPAPQA